MSYMRSENTRRLDTFDAKDVQTGDVAAAFAGLWSKLRAGQGGVWLNIGDSTSTLTYPWVANVTSRIGATFPLVSTAYAVSSGGAWGMPTNVSTGSGGNSFTFADAAAAGQDSAYWSTNLANIDNTYTPDVITVLMSHNDSVGLGGSTWRQLLDDIRARWTNVPIAIVVQNPNPSNGDMTTRRDYIHAYGALHSIPVTDALWRAFGGPVPNTSLYGATVHPNADGVIAWGNVVEQVIGLANNDIIAPATASTTTLTNNLNALIAGLSGSINPLTITNTWTAAYWASDPAWSHPADGAAVSALPDGSVNTYDMAQATGSKQPIYRATALHLNNKPAIDFDGSDDSMTSATNPSVSSPYTLIGIVALDVAQANAILGFSGGSNSRYIGQAGVGGTPWHINAGVGNVRGGTPVLNTGHLVVGYVNGASSRIDVDGVTVVTGDAGTVAANFLTLGAGRTTGGTETAWLNGQLAFAGLVPGQATAATWWALFKTWVTAFYNITIA